MNEAKRIFSNRRLIVILCIPLICLILFFYQKCDGNFANLLPEAREYQNLLVKFRDSAPAEIAEALNSQYSRTDNELRLMAQAEHLRDYGRYLDQVQEQSEKMQLSSLFNDNRQSFVYRNILKTAEDFADCSAEGVSLGNDRAVQDWLAFSWADWAFLAAILLLVMSFLEERKRGLSAIIRSCPAGRGKLQGSRLLILLLYSAGMTLLLYYLPLILSLCLDGGWSGLLRPIQSLAEFRKCTARMTISAFLVQFFFVKTACGLLLGVLVWFVLSFLARPQMGWLATAAGLAVEYLLYILIPAQSIFSPLREINVFSYVFTGGLYTQYTNINFCGFPVGRRTLLLGLLAAAAAVLSAATVLILTRRFPFGNRDLLGRWVIRWNRAGDAIRKRLGLYGFEVYKLVFLGTGGLFLLLGILMTQNLSCGTRAYFGKNDGLYLQYLSEIQGPVTQSTYDYLADAHAALENSEMDTQEYEEILNRLEAAIANLEDGAWLVYESSFMNCYGAKSSETQRENALLAYILLTACLSPLYACEQSGDIRKVLRSTSGGREKLFRAKYAVALTVTAFVWLRVFGEEWRLSANYIGETILAAPCSSIELVKNYPMTVGGFLILLYLSKAVGLLIPMHLCIFIGERSRGFEKAFLFSVLALVIPAAAYYFGADALAFVTPSSVLADKSPFLFGLSAIPLFAVWMLLSLLALIAADRDWCRMP